MPSINYTIVGKLEDHVKSVKSIQCVTCHTLAKKTNVSDRIAALGFYMDGWRVNEDHGPYCNTCFKILKIINQSKK